jgi:hypothetical protein
MAKNSFCFNSGCCLFFESRCSQSTFLTGWGKIYSCIILIQGVIEVFKTPCGHQAVNFKFYIKVSPIYQWL